MNVADALERIDAIHSHLARTEVYRGYRPLALAASGLAGLIAAIVQPWLLSADDPAAFICYWVCVAVACAALAGSATVVGYVCHEDEFARRRTRTVFWQMFPSLLCGAIVTIVFSRQELRTQTIVFLPGLWSLFYGLGTVASMPYLPRPAWIVAVWHIAAGGLLLHLVEGPIPSGLAVGLPFGVGQLLAAGVLLAAHPREIDA